MRLSAPIYQLKRRAKLLARAENIALHAALDRIARDQGFAGWSLLAAQASRLSDKGDILLRLSNGDIVLLGARPGHGKTLLGLKLLIDAISGGRRGVFFTLEYTAHETRERIRSLQGETSGPCDRVEIVTDDDICAEYIIRHLAGAPRGTIAVIDYLQILDQRRDKPALSQQLDALKAFARKAEVIFVFLSQIDRSFDPESKPLPEMKDIRLPNRVDMSLFSKACFLHEGRAEFQALA